MLYVMSYACYKIYMYVCVYCNLFMLTKQIQSNPNEEYLDITVFSQLFSKKNYFTNYQ